jgi:hypothetical protein
LQSASLTHPTHVDVLGSHAGAFGIPAQSLFCWQPHVCAEVQIWPCAFEAQSEGCAHWTHCWASHTGVVPEHVPHECWALQLSMTIPHCALAHAAKFGTQQFPDPSHSSLPWHATPAPLSVCTVEGGGFAFEQA